MQWTIGRKLMALNCTGFLIVVIVGMVGYQGTSQLDRKMDELLLISQALRNHVQADMLHDTLRTDVFQALFAAEHRPEEEAQIKRDLSRHIKEFRELLTANEELALQSRIKEALRRVQPTLEAYITSGEALVGLAFRDRTAAIAQVNSFSDAFTRLEKEMAELSAFISEEAVHARVVGDATANQAYWGLGGTIVVALFVLLSIAWRVTRAVTRPLTSVVGMLRDIAEGEGDLTQRLPVSSKDEIGELARWFNVFVEKLNGILGQVRQAADQVALASQQLSASGEQLSTGSQQQASALEETAASLEEMTGTIKQNADNARQANQLAVGSREVAEKGGQVVTNAVSAMHEINQSSKKISDISGLIDEIAFQTNLLALNAAVEAARAGEQGRGFAVVAAEVRNLAQRSAAAAKEIKGLIRDSTQKVHDGSELVSKSGQTLEEIVTAVKRVTDIMGEIAAASQEQFNNIEQVNRVVGQMDHVVQENAAQTEEMSSTAQTMAQQAQQLQMMVAQFKLTGQQEQPWGMVSQSPPRIGVTVTTPAVKSSAKGYINGHAHGHVNGHAHGRAGGFEEF
ncbi:MAG: HAMP domain-containing protein [Deltaproteobacteria bacterium]|nr:HAMP domain-containing protein [Deltaproteobacteria bacterium]